MKCLQDSLEFPFPDGHIMRRIEKFHRILGVDKEIICQTYSEVFAKIKKHHELYEQLKTGKRCLCHVDFKVSALLQKRI